MASPVQRLSIKMVCSVVRGTIQKELCNGNLTGGVFYEWLATRRKEWKEIRVIAGHVVFLPIP
jgi:hypothetical protein